MGFATGGLAWLLVNIAYLDLRRRGQGGWLRFFAFWGGLPTTLLVALIVPEGKPRRRRGLERGDDAEGLLDEIREDRRLREAAGGGSPGTRLRDSSVRAPEPDGPDDVFEPLGRR